MTILTKEQVLMLHERLIEATGGSRGIRDEGMLESALYNPFQSFGGEELYPSIQGKAAQLCYGLVYSQQELSDIILALASGKIGAEELLQWIIHHQK
ncbi:MAG: Fic family protein [Eubacteriales bacterium]|nr:Fic family protein [Eubacteriales bacterium]